jgi:hypothetical protein
MQALSFSTLPIEIVTQILSLTDVKGIRALLFLDKETLKIKDTVLQYLNDVKLFYASLIHLQQQYCSKKHINYSGPGYDRDIMTQRVITGKIIQINVNTACIANLILEPALTEKEKEYLNRDIKFYTTPQNRCSRQEDAAKLQHILDKDSAPKDLILKPTLKEEYFTQMKDTSEAYEKSSYWYKRDNFVDVVIFCITQFSLTFNPTCTLPEEIKRKITQSVDWANEFYLKTSQDKKKLEGTIDVNTLEWGT